MPVISVMMTPIESNTIENIENLYIKISTSNEVIFINMVIRAMIPNFFIALFTGLTFTPYSISKAFGSLRITSEKYILRLNFLVK